MGIFGCGDGCGDNWWWIIILLFLFCGCNGKDFLCDILEGQNLVLILLLLLLFCGCGNNDGICGCGCDAPSTCGCR